MLNSREESKISTYSIYSLVLTQEAPLIQAQHLRIHSREETAGNLPWVIIEDLEECVVGSILGWFLSLCGGCVISTPEKFGMNSIADFHQITWALNRERIV